MTITQVPTATISFDWTHPRHGRIQELVCGRHEQELLKALHVLGIGCGVERYGGPVGCGRCVAEAGTIHPREYVPTRAQA